jgi:hypothetical protein
MNEGAVYLAINRKMVKPGRDCSRTFILLCVQLIGEQHRNGAISKDHYFYSLPLYWGKRCEGTAKGYRRKLEEIKRESRVESRNVRYSPSHKAFSHSQATQLRTG